MTPPLGHYLYQSQNRPTSPRKIRDGKIRVQEAATTLIDDDKTIEANNDYGVRGRHASIYTNVLKKRLIKK